MISKINFYKKANGNGSFLEGLSNPVVLDLFYRLIKRLEEEEIEYKAIIKNGYYLIKGDIELIREKNINQVESRTRRGLITYDSYDNNTLSVLFDIERREVF